MKFKVAADIESMEIRSKIYDATDALLRGFTVRVHPTGKKVFIIRYMLPNGARGRYTIGVFGHISLNTARTNAKKILGEANLGIDPKAKLKPASSKLTLKNFIEAEYRSWSEAHHQWSADYIAKLYRLTVFINTPLDDISPQQVEKWRADSFKNKQSPATINRNLSALRAVLSKAVEWGVIEKHPLSKVKQLKVDRSPNVRYLSEDEEKRLRFALDERELTIRESRENGNQWREERGYELYADLSEVPFVDHLKPLVLLSVNTGARRGELYRLQWEDINFDRKSLALVMRGKRKSHTRHIPLNKEAFETLVAWRTMRPHSDKFVFPGKNGEVLDNTQTSWETLKKNARISNFRWHDMRHHFASRLVMNGVPLNTVRELLGHTNLEMTLRYAHLAPEQKEKAVATLDRL